DLATIAVCLVRDHRLARVECFGPDATDAALARYAELTAGAVAPTFLTNAATIAHERWIAAFVEQRWDDIRAMQAEGDVFMDHRSVIGGEVTLGIDETHDMLRGLITV